MQARAAGSHNVTGSRFVRLHPDTKKSHIFVELFFPRFFRLRLFAHQSIQKRLNIDGQGGHFRTVRLIRFHIEVKTSDTRGEHGRIWSNVVEFLNQSLLQKCVNFSLDLVVFDSDIKGI